MLLGAVGGPKWDDMPGDRRPEKALLGIRYALGLYTNLRPAKMFPALKGASPLREDIISAGFDIMIVRELTGGIYFGDRGYRQGKFGEEAYDTEAYSVREIERIGRAAFDIAMKRDRRVTSIDKANVLETSRLWRKTMHSLAGEYPEVTYSDMLVDNTAMQLVRNPKQFDVIVTSNMFGDILSDEASQITGSIGMLASASLGDSTLGMYEPIHGSAPDIAGTGKANPIATILSAAMMLRYSFGLSEEADRIENAVDSVLNEGARTADILAALGAEKKPGQFLCGFSMETENMLENSIKKLKKKNLDLIAANNLKVAGAGFQVDTNVLTLIGPDSVRELPLLSKDAAADALLDEILRRMENKS